MTVFAGDTNTTVYYLAGTTGWGSTFGGRPTAPYTILQLVGNDLGNGWKWRSWFGYFSTYSSPWIYHCEHGWVYCVGPSTANLWLWSNRLGWSWTSDSVYPFLWSDTSSAWLYYYEGSGTGLAGWFYNFSTQQWEWK